MDSEKYQQCKKDYEYAISVLYRDNLVAERVEKINKRLEECVKDGDTASKEAIEKLLQDLSQKQYAHNLKGAIEEAEAILKRLIVDCTREYPRFCDRIIPCINSAKDRFKDKTKLCAADAKIQQIYEELEKQSDEWTQKVNDWEVEDKLQRAMYDPKSALNSAIDYLKRMGIYSDTDRLNEKIKTDIGNVKSNPLFFGLKSFEKQLNEFYVKYDDYQDQLNLAYLNKEIKEKIEKVAYPLDIINLPHYFSSDRDLVPFVEKMSEAFEAFDDFKNSSPDHYKQTKTYIEFCQKHQLKVNNMQKKFNDLQIVWEQRKGQEKVTEPLGLVNAYIQFYKFDQALEEIDNAKSALNDLQQDKRFNLKPEVITFLGKKIKDISDYENKINETLLKDQFQQESQTVNQVLGNCEIFIQRQEFDNVAMHLEDAKQQFNDLNNNKKYQGRKDYEEFYQRFKTKLEETETKFGQVMVAHDFQSETQRAQSELGIAEAKLHFHQEDQALDYIDRATETRFDIEYNRKFQSIEAKVKEFVTSFDNKAKALREKIEEKVLGDQVRDALNSVGTTFSIMNGKFQGYDMQGCLEYAEKASDELIELGNNRRLEPRIEKGFIEKKMKELADTRQKCVEYAVKENFKSQSYRAIDPINTAMIQLKSEQYAWAQESFEQSQSAHFDNLYNKDFEKYSELLHFDDYKKKYDTLASEYKEAFFQSVFQSKFKKKTQNIQTLLSNARAYFESYKYVQSLEYAQQAQEKGSKLINNKTVGDREETRVFFEKFKVDLQKFYSDYDQRMLEEKKTNLIRSIEGNISMIKAQIQFKKQEGVVEAIQNSKQSIQEARYSMAELQIEEAVLQQKEAEVLQIEAEYEKSMLQEELKKLQSNVSQALTSLKASLSQGNYRDQYPNGLQSAKDSINELAGRFNNNKDVDTFIKNQQGEIEKLNQQFDEKVCKERIKELTENVKMLISNADIYFNCNNRPQSFEFLEQAGDALKNLQIREFPERKEVQAFCETTSKQIEEQKQKYIQILLNESLKLTTRNIFDYLNQAESYINNGDAQRAMESLEKSKEQLADLAVEKFMGNKEVREILDKWNKRYQEINNIIGEVLQKKTVRELENDLGTLVSTSEAYISQYQYERVVEFLEKLRSKLTDAQEDDNLKNLKEVKELITKYQGKVDSITQKLNETLFNQEVVEKCRRARSTFGVAQAQFQTFSYENAIKSLQECKDYLKTELVDNQNYKGRKDVEQIVQELNQGFLDFEKKYQETVLKEQTAKFVMSINQNLEQVKQYQQRNATDLVLETLQKSKDEFSNVDSLIANSQQGQDLKKKIDAAYSAVAQQLCGQQATTLISILKQDSLIINDYFELNLHDQAREVIGNIEKSDYYQDIIKNSLMLTFDIVKEFLANFKKLAEKLKYSLADGGDQKKKKTVGGGQSDNGDLIRGIFGELIPNDIDILKVISISTSIPAKIIGSLQQYNKNVQVLRGQVQSSKRKINALKFTLKDMNSKPHFVNDETSENTIRDVKRFVVELKETLPEHEIVENVVKDFETFEENLKTNKAMWKEINTMVQDYVLFQDAVAHLEKAYEEGEGGYNNTSMYGYDHNHTYVSLNHHWPFLFEMFEKVHDNDQYMWIYNKYKLLTSKLENYEKFPGKDNLLELFQQNQDKCLIMHMKYNIRRFWLNHDSQSRETYWKSLAQFPFSREYCLGRLAEEKAKCYLEREHEEKKDKAYTLPKTDFSSSSNSFAEKEQQLWDQVRYPYDKVQPGEDGELVHGKSTDSESSSQRLWTPLKEKYQGQVIFSDQTIEKTERNESILKNTFVLGQGEIHMRAIWKRTISSYALGKHFQTNQPLYGPKHIDNTHRLYLYFFLEIDGEEYKYPHGRYGSLTYHLQQSSSQKQDESDFYSYMQGIRLGLSMKNLNLMNYWDINSQRFNYICKSLTPDVEHKIKIKICFQIESQQQWKQEPQWDSLMSTPICEGEFNLIVPQDYKLPSILPNVQECYAGKLSENAVATNPQEKERLQKMFEEGIQNYVGKSKETVVQALITNKSEYFVSAKHWLHLYPIQYGLDFMITFYRNPIQGWPKEKIFIQQCSCYTEKYEGVKPHLSNNNGGFGFGSHAEFEGCLVSDEELSQYQIDRANFK